MHRTHNLRKSSGINTHQTHSRRFGISVDLRGACPTPVPAEHCLEFITNWKQVHVYRCQCE